MNQTGAPTPALDYDPGEGCFDEAFAGPGEPREHYREFFGSQAAGDRLSVGRQVLGGLRERGVAFGEGSEFVVDPVPRIIPAHEWETLERGLAQRVRALDAFVCDVYGPGEILDAGIVPRETVLGATHYERALAGLELQVPWVNVAGLDLVRDAQGRWLALEDNLRTPSGVAYAAAARDVLDERLPVRAPAGRRPATEAFSLLGASLRALAPCGQPDPFVVVLTDGPSSAAYYEHAAIARRLGAELATPDRLESWRGWLVLRDEHRRHRVDVVYRRTDEDRLTDESGNPTAVGAMLLEPWQRGRVGCANAFGTGVADDKLMHAYVPDMIRFYLREEPLLPSVPTYDLGRPEVRDDVLARVHEVVIKPREGYGGQGILIGPRATEAERREAVAAVRAHPSGFVAQETVTLSRHPTVAGAQLEPRHVDLRPFVYMTPGGASVAPGGLTRVALRRGSLVVNSSQHGGAKDTWVTP